MVTCKHCQRTVKLNEIIRSATHDLGCVHCFGNPEAETPVMVAERIASRAPLGVPNGRTLSELMTPPSRRPFTLNR